MSFFGILVYAMTILNGNTPLMQMRFALTLLMMTTLAFPAEPDLKKMAARFERADIKADVTKLSPNDRKALAKLAIAAQIFDELYMKQLWSGNPALYAKLKQDRSPLGQARLQYFWINKGPWSDLDEHKAFLPGVPERKPLGANFYPEDMTREEFEKWPAKDIGFFSVIRRNPGKQLTAVPYSQAYAVDLNKASGLLREAAALTENASLTRAFGVNVPLLVAATYGGGVALAAFAGVLAAPVILVTPQMGAALAAFNRHFWPCYSANCGSGTRSVTMED